MAAQISELIPIRPTDPGSWPETLSAPAKGLLEYWVSRCSDRRYPRRAAIQPGRISPILPHIFIVDRLDDGKSDYRFRLVGTSIATIEGECTGRLLSEMIPDRDIHANIWRHYDECRSGTIYIRRQNLGWQGRAYLEYEVCLLPLYGDGESVDHLIGTAHGMLPPE